MSEDTQHPLRKVAILVASLDEQSADRVLALLPTKTAQTVLEVANQLGPIDSHEQQKIVKEFRRNMAAELTASTPVPSTPIDHPIEARGDEAHGVELDASLIARLESEGKEAQDPSSFERDGTYTQPQVSSGTQNPLSHVDPAWVADMLAKEHPQTIAVALSRFEHLRAASILGEFSLELQAEVLSRLSDLDKTDPQTLRVVESQLAEWLNQKQQKKQRMADGADLVQRILDNSPQTQRQTILTRIQKLKPDLAGRLVVDTTGPQQSTLRKPKKVFRPIPVMSPKQLPSQPPPAEDKYQSANPMSDIESADNQTLLDVFSKADRRTVMLALAGASETLLKRILHGMPRRQAKQFRNQLRTLGPTPLSDMLSAQQEIARMSCELQAIEK